MIAIINYNAGNILSVSNAINSLGYESIVTDDIATIQNADKVILPGVGEASSAMNYLRSKNLDKTIVGLQNPFLGICLGLQLLCKHSEEGDTECLGVFDTKVRLFPPKLKVPHMGWNDFVQVEGPLFNSIGVDDDVYYVHSFFADLSCDTIATCDYIHPFSAALGKDNFFATQFHPEKSASVGQQILKNFLEI